MDYRSIKIKKSEFIVSNNVNDFLKTKLLESGFIMDREISEQYDFNNDAIMFYQRIDPRDFLFIDFNWPWEPEWKRIKKLLTLKLNKV